MFMYVCLPGQNFILVAGKVHKGMFLVSLPCPLSKEGNITTALLAVN